MARLEEKLGSLQVFGGVDTYGLYVGEAHTDAVAVLEPTELFETLGLL